MDASNLRTVENPKPMRVRTGTVIDDVRRVTLAHGYAVGVHGSLREEADIDLMVVPWYADAHPAQAIVDGVDALDYLDRIHLSASSTMARLQARYVVKWRAVGCPLYVDLTVLHPGGDRA